MKHLILITLTSMLLVACSQEPFAGVKESYYENGQLKERGNYIAGKEDGLWEMYYENGEWHAKSIYKNGKRIDHQWQFQARDRY